MTSSDELRIGISGWRYAGWRGKFYLKGAVAAATADLNVLSAKATEID